MEVDLLEETKTQKIQKEIVEEFIEPEPEIIELGERNAVLFSLETAQSVNFNEIPDSFFDLTVEDVRKLLKDIRKQSSTLTDAPMLTAKMREIEASNTILKQMTQYNTTVIRIQFPDRYVLQGTFTPVETIETVMEFIRPYLKDPKMEFYICEFFFIYLLAFKSVYDSLTNLPGNPQNSYKKFLNTESSTLVVKYLFKHFTSTCA